VGLACDGLCEQQISLAVGIPGSFIKHDFTRVIMQKRPEDGVYSWR
jgi:hypothetical protein